jgi:hypothetical protein
MARPGFPCTSEPAAHWLLSEREADHRRWTSDLEQWESELQVWRSQADVFSQALGAWLEAQRRDLEEHARAIEILRHSIADCERKSVGETAALALSGDSHCRETSLCEGQRERHLQLRESHERLLAVLEQIPRHVRLKFPAAE